MVVRLDVAAAPVTTKNFLHYVDAGTYNGATFYRTVRRSSEPQARIEVIQGGLNLQVANPMIKPIPLEPTSKTHLHNTDGTLAMARMADPNSASTEFFIDIGDDRFLDADRYRQREPRLRGARPLRHERSAMPEHRVVVPAPPRELGNSDAVYEVYADGEK